MTGRDPNDLRVALVLLRELRGWTREALADASGVPASTVSEYETGELAPSAGNLRRLMEAFRFPPPLLDGLLAFLRALRQVITLGDAPGAGSPAEIDRVAAGTGQAVEELTRASFSLAVAQLAPAGSAPAAADRREAPALWARLEPLSPAERLGLVRGGERFRGWALAERLCAESAREAADRPEKAVELAELALEIARLVPGDERWRARLQGYVLVFLGHAHRVSGNLPAAEEAFARSREAWQEAAEPPARLEALADELAHGGSSPEGAFDLLGEPRR
jgi:transcriptional regulator with XRE-family HTH domain